MCVHVHNSYTTWVDKWVGVYSEVEVAYYFCVLGPLVEEGHRSHLGWVMAGSVLNREGQRG